MPSRYGTRCRGNYRTNLELNEIIALLNLVGEIERENIRYRVIDNFYAYPGLSPQGDQVLYPDFAAIRDLIQETFYAQSQLTPAEMKARADEENPPVYVFNGTNIAGLAGETRDWLVSKGLRVDDIGNDVTNGRALTEILEYGRYPWTARGSGCSLMGLPVGSDHARRRWADRPRRGGGAGPGRGRDHRWLGDYSLDH